MKRIKIRFLTIILISIISLEVPINYLTHFYIFPYSPLKNLANPLERERLQAQPSDGPIIMPPPEPKDVYFSYTPVVHFSIRYPSNRVEMNIFLKNNNTAPLTLLNLWIQVNKSDIDERILLSETKVVESQQKIILSTFDNDEMMIFHIKLYEGEIIAINEEFHIELRWFDTDQIIAQFEPANIYNRFQDDIQAYFQYSDRLEDFQPFPIIERHFYQELDEEGGKIFHVDFRLINLMGSSLNTFNFTYIKMKDFIFETSKGFEIISPFLSSQDMSNIIPLNEEDNEKIIYSLSLGDSISLNPNEWLIIKTKWVGNVRDSSISRDLIFWNTGYYDPFNIEDPFYLVGNPFFSILSPAEPIITPDYDFDGLKNNFEKQHFLDPLNGDVWLIWESLRREYFLDKLYAQNFEIGAEIKIFIPYSYSQQSLTMSIENLASDCEIINLKVNGDLLYDVISQAETKLITNNANDFLYNINFTLIHGSTLTDSYFNIKFLIDGYEIPDLTEYFNPDSDGDGLNDFLETNDCLYVPDLDNDGLFDSADISPDFSYDSNSRFNLNFPIKYNEYESEIAVSIQIHPTIHDYSNEISYGGNSLIIQPGIRIFNEFNGGDYLPNNGFSIDDGKTQLVSLQSFKHSFNNKPYTWMGHIDYKSNNPARLSNQITLSFSLVWLLFEKDIATDEFKFVHVYENSDTFKIQGISIEEKEPINIALGIDDDGECYRKAIMNAELLGHLSVSDISYDIEDISGFEYSESAVFNVEDVKTKRNELRTQILEEKNLEVDESYFTLVTYGYSLAYDINLLFNIFGENNLERIYSPSEIDLFYSLPENTFTGTATAQVLLGENSDTINFFTYGIKGDTETKMFNLQFDKYTYIGSSCSEIYAYNGFEGDDSIEIYYLDFNNKNSRISTKSSEGNYIEVDIDEYSSKVQRHEIIRFPEEEWLVPGTPSDFIGILQYLGEWLTHPIIRLIRLVLLDAPWWYFLLAEKVFKFSVYFKPGSSHMVYKFGRWISNHKPAINKAVGVLMIVAGTIEIIFGIIAWSEGMFASAGASFIRGGLQILTGALLISGVGAPVAAILGIFLLVDWVLDYFFGFDLWESILNLLGFENADPSFDIKSSSLIYNGEAVKEHGGFRVGDKITFSVRIKNDGNTDFTFKIKIKAGEGNWGALEEEEIDEGDTETITTEDTFQYPSAATSIRTYFWANWKHYPPKICIPIPWPPWKQCWQPSPVTGDPVSQTDEFTLDVPVFPNSINTFLNLVENNLWFPISTPKLQINNQKTEIIPITSEYLLYDLKVNNPSNERHTYRISIPNELWNTKFYGQPYYCTYYDVSISGKQTITVPIRFEPTSQNRLISGDFNLIISVQQEDLTLAKNIIRCYYTVYPLVHFNVVFDPEVPFDADLTIDEYLPYFIRVTNTGNMLDHYLVEA